ncbi:MAG: TonB-dependent siderophore receptor [Acidobacteriota bacterium]
MMSRRNPSRLMTFLLFFTLIAGLGPAVVAEEAMPVAGKVVDATGGALPGVWVTLRLADGGERTASTDRRGAFRFDAVPKGDHRLDFELSGFSPTGQELRHGAEASELEVELSVTVAEQITVRDAVPYRSLQAVTATRTETPLLEVPQSIEVLPIEIGESQGALTVGDMLRNVSGAVPDTAFQGTQDGFFLRGFSVQPVLRNGYRRTSNVGLTPLANVDRLEVLKGPAAVLYGSGSLGGVINVVTAKPLPQVARSAALEIGSYDHYGARVDLNGPFSDGSAWRYRLNASHQDFESWRSRVEGERTLIAPVVSWEPDESTRLIIEGEQYEQSLPVFATGVLFTGDGLLELPVERNLAAPWTEFDRRNRTLGVRFERLLGSTFELRADLQTVDYEEFTLADYLTDLGPDGRTAGRAVYLNDFDVVGTDTGRLELLADTATGSVRHTLLFGVEVARDNFGGDSFFSSGSVPLDVLDPTFPATPPDQDGPFFFEQEQDFTGVYVQDQIDFGPRVKALAGVRWDTLDTSFRFERSADFDPAMEDEAVSPRFGLVVMARPELSLFAGYARSFEPNGRTDLLGNYLDPERGEQIEAGFKWLPKDGRLSVNGAVFDLVRSDVATRDPFDPRLLVAIGEQSSQGVEIDLTGRLSDRLRAVASASYLWESEITEDVLRPVGSRFINVPEETASLWLNYDLPSAAWGGVSLGGGAFYVGDRPGELALDPFSFDDYLLVHAAVEVRTEIGGRSYGLALNGRNLTDERYVEAGQGPFANYYGAPRTVMLTLRGRF